MGARLGRCVLVYFAAGATDLAAANAQAAIDGARVVDLATDNSITVALPGPLRSLSQAYAVAPQNAGGYVTTTVDINGGAYAVDPGAIAFAAGETGSVVVTYGAPAGTILSGFVAAVLTC